MKVYLAAPLFTLGERHFNASLARMIHALNKDAEVYLPQDNPSVAIGAIFGDNVAAIHTCDWVVAVCDGSDMDSGTAWEIGFASALGKKIIAIRTDFRAVGDDCDIHFSNLMITMSVRHRVHRNSQSTSIVDIATDIAHLLRHG